MERREVLKYGAAGAGFLFSAPLAQGAEEPPVPKAPTLVVRRAAERGHANHGWLDTWHTFSFGRYYDARHMGFRALRVINEDFIDPAAGFPMHPHNDMEIVTYVLEGALQHRDSLGNGSVIRPGEVQRMSAGTGIRHSEFNPSRDRRVHLLQIWLLPERQGLKPGYAQQAFAATDRSGRLKLVASRDGRDQSLRIHTDVSLYASILPRDGVVEHRVETGRHVWIQVARGRLAAGEVTLEAGDGARTSEPGLLRLKATQDAEFLLFDLA